MIIRRRKPHISFYMSVKNGGCFLPIAIDSIRRQSIKDWEAIIIDDGSSDETPDRLVDIAKTDSRFRIRLTPGIGRGQALNLAVSLCRAPIVSNLDADDITHPASAASYIAHFKTNPKFSVLTGEAILINGHESPQWNHGPSSPGKALDITTTLTRRNPVIHSCTAIRKAALQEVKLYNALRVSQYDYDLWVRMARHGHRIGRIPMPLAASRIHAGQGFQNKRHLRYVLKSEAVRWRAVHALGSPILESAMYSGFHLCWAMVPRKTRYWIKAQALGTKPR